MDKKNTIDIHCLFPKVVAKTNLPLTVNELANLNVSYANAQFVPSRPGENHPEMSKSLYVLNGMPWLANKINDVASGFIKDIMKYKKTRLALSTSWFTKTQPGQYSNMHKHANNIYTGVFYWDNEVHSEISLEDFDSGHHWEIQPETDNQLNRVTWSFKMDSCDLIIFPSEVHHKIEPWVGKDIRKSLAFNWIPVGELGYGDSRVVI